MSDMTPAQRAAHLALMVLKELTGPSMTFTPEQFDALVKETKDTCADAGLDLVDLYRYVMKQNPAIADVIRYPGLRQQLAGACMRPH